MSTIKFLRTLVLDNMENQLDCELDMAKPAEAQKLKDYMVSCLCALAFLERADGNSPLSLDDFSHAMAKLRG